MMLPEQFTQLNTIVNFAEGILFDEKKHTGKNN